jgi:hypothetical protein
LYKEDFEKFADGFTDVIDYIKNVKSTEQGVNEEMIHHESEGTEDYTSVDFEDLESVEVEDKQRKG